MLSRCQGDRWPIQCLMVNEVERDFHNAWLFSSLFGQFISLVVSDDVYVGFDFADGDIAVRGF